MRRHWPITTHREQSRDHQGKSPALCLADGIDARVHGSGRSGSRPYADADQSLRTETGFVNRITLLSTATPSAASALLGSRRASADFGSDEVFEAVDRILDTVASGVSDCFLPVKVALLVDEPDAAVTSRPADRVVIAAHRSRMRQDSNVRHRRHRSGPSPETRGDDPLKRLPLNLQRRDELQRWHAFRRNSETRSSGSLLRQITRQRPDRLMTLRAKSGILSKSRLGKLDSTAWGNRK